MNYKLLKLILPIALLALSAHGANVAGKWPINSPSISTGVGEGLVSEREAVLKTRVAEAGSLPLRSNPGP